MKIRILPIFGYVQFTMFSTSRPQFILQNHKLFPKVDWERVDAGNYAVVDPVNPRVILYLSEQDYIVMVRVAITSNKTLKVLAAPGETPTTSKEPDPSQNSPKSSPWADILKLGRRTSEGRRGKERFLNLWRSRLSRFFAKKRATVSSVKGVQGISMIGLTGRNILQWFDSWHEIVSWWSRGSVLTTAQKNESANFGRHLLGLLMNNGVNHVIARLKIMLFVVNAYLGGRRLTSTAELGFRVRLRKGLPAALPCSVRAGIRFGNKHYIHVWTSMLFSYKGIQGTWQEPHLANGSICNPMPQLQDNPIFLDFEKWVSVFWQMLRKAGAKLPDFKVKGTFFSTHAGPNHPVTILGAGIDAFLWMALDQYGFKKVKNAGTGLIEYSAVEGPDAWFGQALRSITGVSRNYIREWLEATNQADIWQQIRMTGKMFRINHDVLRHVQSANDLLAIIASDGTETPLYSSTYLYRFFGLNTRGYRFKNPTLQRLHNLYEAAGKVRTIAIVDYWTNFVLKPVHDWMFTLLELLPQDASFDQEGRVREFSTRDYKEVFSYDLKSATDLIPFVLYRALFGFIFPRKILDLWSDLLVARDFLIPKSTLKAHPSHPVRIKYTTGQPMGALTSWASMALVHHALVLYAAVRARVVQEHQLLNFRDYMVLGDDIVIANKAVAEMYVSIMKELKVPLSLSKSHFSDIGMFNFANQTFVGPLNVSPVSLREEINAVSLPERIEMTLRMARRQWMDLTSRTWVTPLVKKLLGPEVWHALQPDIRSRVVPPVVRWILATILTPGTTRIGFAGLSEVTLEICLGAMLRKADLWGFRMARFGDLIHRNRSRALLGSILARWVNAVYTEFLRSRKRLELFPQWVTRVVSVDLEWLFLRVFEDARSAALARWVAKYRMPLKEIQVSANLSKASIEAIEIGSGRPWDSIVPFVAEAEAALPTIPDFSQENLDALTGLETGGAGAVNDRAARESFMRVTNILGMIDHLSVSGAPGFSEAWDYSQSSESPGGDNENKNP